MDHSRIRSPFCVDRISPDVSKIVSAVPVGRAFVATAEEYQYHPSRRDVDRSTDAVSSG